MKQPMHVISCLFVALATLIAAPSVSSAGPGDAKASADAEASGREHFQRGQRLSARGEYAAAYREFAAGFALTERPLFLFNMAEAARAMGDVAKARDNYQQFLRADPKNALAATAQGRLAELDRTAAASAPPPAAPPPAPPPAAAPAPAVTTAPSAKTPEAPVRLPPPEAARPPARSPAMTADETALPPESPTTAQADSAPIWKKWPFWAAVSGAVVGVTIMYAVSRKDDACGTGCSELNFR